MLRGSLQDGYERITTESIKRQPAALPGATAPEGANITSDKRVGDADRDKVVSHLQEMHVNGYLSDDELAVRLAHAEQATTHAELNVVLPDLPPFPQPKKLPKEPKPPKTLRERFSEPHAGTVIAIFLLTIASLSAITLPWVAVSAHSPHPSATLMMAAAFATIVGLMGCIGSITWTLNVFD